MDRTANKTHDIHMIVPKEINVVSLNNEADLNMQMRGLNVALKENTRLTLAAIKRPKHVLELLDFLLCVL